MEMQGMENARNGKCKEWRMQGKKIQGMDITRKENARKANARNEKCKE